MTGKGGELESPDQEIRVSARNGMAVFSPSGKICCQQRIKVASLSRTFHSVRCSYSAFTWKKKEREESPLPSVATTMEERPQLGMGHASRDKPQKKACTLPLPNTLFLRTDKQVQTSLVETDLGP